MLSLHSCPWDREQTHESFRTYLTGETYKVLEALEAGDFQKFQDELGDLLFVAVILARLLRVDPRIGLKKASQRFTAWHQAMEEAMLQRSGHLAQASREEMGSLWEP